MAPTPGTLDPAEIPQSPSEAPPESPYGPDNRDLPEQLVDVLRSTIVEFQGQGKYLRRREVRRDWKLRLYQEGFQHLQWKDGTGYSQLIGGGTVTNSSGGSMQCPTYMDAYNIFLRFFLIVQAVLTQTLPSVRWQPIDPSNPDDIDKNKEAQNYARLFDRFNDVKDILGQIVRMLGMSGRTVSWTRTEEDSQRFGFEADGVTPKRFQRTTIHGTLETKVPVTCREFDKTCLHVFIFHDYDIKFAKSKYPWVADQLKTGVAALGETQYERFARLGVLNGSRGQSQVGDALSYIESGGDFFLRPAAFTGPRYDAEMEGGGTIKEALLQLFPQGCRAVFEGDVYCASYAESMDDHLDMQWPYQGDGMSRQAFMEVMVIVQDNFNDLCNWIREKVDTGAGETFANGTQDEIDAITSQRAAPNAIRAAKSFKETGEPLANGFYKTPDPEIPATLFKLLEFMRGDLPEFLLAALPSIQGGEMSDNGTASGYAMATANAKGQLGIIWSRMQRMFARIRYQSALAAAQDEASSGTVNTLSPTGETIAVNLDALKKGNFGCYPDEDSGFPETTAQKRLILKDWVQMAGESPMAAELFDNVDNIEQMKELNGFADMTFIPAEARTKQLHEIEKLLRETPIPPDPAMLQQAQTAHAAEAFAAQDAGGQAPPFTPPSPRSSVPVGKYDYHQYEFQTGRQWLSSKARRDEEEKGNTAGIDNVTLHLDEHDAYIQQAAMAQAAMAAPQSGKGQPSPPANKKDTPGTRVPQGA